MCSRVGETTKKSVAIIGCGASGLAALKNFASEHSQFECVAFEQTDSIGGTWVYTDDVDTDQYGLPVHSSMYKSLRYTRTRGRPQIILARVRLNDNLRYYYQIKLAKRNHGTEWVPS